MTGKLIGVGLGPGAPDLITLRAARFIQSARVIAYPALAGADSFAREIAADFIPEGAKQIVIDIPMTTDRRPAQDAYDRAAVEISDALNAGHDVVCLCEGDPLFYGSFMYIQSRLRDRFDVEVVPGVTSVTSCAARAGIPIAARNQSLTIVPGPMPAPELRAKIDQSESVVIMKLGRHLPKVRAIIEELGLLDRAIYVERATLQNERIMPLADLSGAAPYFSMILLTKGTDPWL